MVVTHPGLEVGELGTQLLQLAPQPLVLLLGVHRLHVLAGRSSAKLLKLCARGKESDLVIRRTCHFGKITYLYELLI